MADTGVNALRTPRIFFNMIEATDSEGWDIDITINFRS